MRKFVFTLLLLSLLCSYSCDDGDVITFELEFDEDFSACGETNLVLFKTKNTPSESLSVVINNLNVEDLLEVDNDNNLTLTKTGAFNYRTYSNETLPTNLFCNDIPPAEVKIVEDDSDDSVNATFTTKLVEDDQDGVLAALEDVDGNGDLTNDDTDEDGLPNYIDADDDGDNVLTKDENPDPNGDGNFDDALDTDGDGIPNYLDADDDGDGIDTRDEENESQDQNPGNDVTNSDVGADYLNKDVANVDTPKATAYRNHTIIQTYTVTLTITDIALDLISIDEFDFGLLNDSSLSGSRTETPNFN